MRSIDPSTGELVTTWEFLTPRQTAARLHRAQIAARAWRSTPLSVRCDHLRSIAAALRDGVDDLAPFMTREMGKPIAEATAEVLKCAWVCEHYADHAAEMLAPTLLDTGAETYLRYDPVGVVLAVMPWNFPFWQVLRFAAPALAAGNAMLIKHAPNTLGCAQAIESLCLESGLPAGLLTNLMIGVEQVPDVIAHPAVAAVTLTGSERAGAAVAAVAGQHLKKTVLELGGSDPFIVLADADLDEAVAQGVFSRCLNSGQSCIAAKRFLVEESVADLFTDKLVDAMQARRMGDPRDEGTQLGPMARADLRALLHDQVVRSVEAGARVRCGGAIPDGPGFYYPPTVLDDVTEGMAAASEETFGPVAAVLRVRDAEHAIAVANRSRYGLGASLWTADRDRARALAARIDSGAVFINKMTASDPRVPFGGVKMSGYGRELGVLGIREFVNIKTVWVE